MIDARQHYDRAKPLAIIRSLVPGVLTMTELAARAGVDRRTLQRYMSGQLTPSYMAQVTLEGIYRDEIKGEK